MALIIDSYSTVPRPDARITFDPMMDNYTVGLFLTLGCEVTLSSAVDTMVNLDPIWRREGVVLTTGDQFTVGDFPMTSDDQVYTSLLEFQPLTRDFIGNDTLYECEASVVPQNDTFITGTITNTSTTITVGGEGCSLYIVQVPVCVGGEGCRVRVYTALCMCIHR